MDDAAKAAKRAEIEAKVAAMKAEQKRLEVRAGDDAFLPPNDPRASRSSPEPPRPLNLANAPSIPQDQKATHFGEHRGITCDGCGTAPIIGYRYRCRKCANHDVCEACYERWAGGNGTVANGLAKQTISLDPKDHDFFVHKENGFKPLVKQQGPTAKSEKKVKPNDPCPCGSGKKHKKCCGGSA